MAANLYPECKCDLKANVCKIYVQELGGSNYRFTPCAEFRQCRLWPATSPWIPQAPPMELKCRVVSPLPQETILQWLDDKGDLAAYVMLTKSDKHASLTWMAKTAASTGIRDRCTPAQIKYLKGLCPATLKVMLKDYPEDFLITMVLQADMGLGLHQGGRKALETHCIKLGFREPKSETEIKGIPDFDLCATVGELRRSLPTRSEHASLLRAG